MNIIPSEETLSEEAAPTSIIDIRNKLTDKTTMALEAEEHLFQLRDRVEVIWVEIGAVMSYIVDNKLYAYRQDENGNYFRTTKAYFEYLDRKFTERGWSLSRSTLYRFADDYRLFVKRLGMDAQDCATLGKSTLQRLAPGVRRLVQEDKVEEAKELVREVLTAVETNGGLPPSEVELAIDDHTGRVIKSLQVEFEERAVGYRLKKLYLWWDNLPVDLLRQQMTEEQAAWVAKRLGNKFSDGEHD